MDLAKKNAGAAKSNGFYVYHCAVFAGFNVSCFGRFKTVQYNTLFLMIHLHDLTTLRKKK